jgi:hypothetical protein
MMTVVDDLVNSMVAEKSFLGKPLNEAKARANSQVSSSGMAQWKTKEPTRQQPLRQAAPAFSRDAHQVPNKAANGSLMRAEMKSHVETIWQEHPTASQAYRSKEELFDRMFYGKTVTEIYEILARGEKRKRVSDGEGDDNGLLHKKAGQCGAMKE